MNSLSQLIMLKLKINSCMCSIIIYNSTIGSMPNDVWFVLSSINQFINLPSSPFLMWALLYGLTLDGNFNKYVLSINIPQCMLNHNYLFCTVWYSCLKGTSSMGRRAWSRFYHCWNFRWLWWSKTRLGHLQEIRQRYKSYTFIKFMMILDEKTLVFL